MNQTILYLTLSLSTFCFTNCNQCETTQCTDGNTKNRISTVLKNYFYFKTGSWWVYENELSLERDSIYVVQDKIERIMPDESCKCNEQLFVRIGTSTNDSIFYNTSSEMSSAISFMKVLVGSSNYDYTYRFEVQNDTALKLENQHNGIIQYLPEYAGPKGNYSKVYRCFYNKVLTDYLSDSYFAPHIGLIRFTYKEGDGTYWNLINYHVIQ